MLSLRQITRSYRVQRAIGVTAAHYLSFVWHTTRLTIEPAGAVERIAKQAPIILAMWHGQHFLMPFLRPKDMPVKVLISRHRDGEINAAAVEALGNETIRGSGSHGPDVSGKGGLFAFNAVVRALETGFTVVMTALDGQVLIYNRPDPVHSVLIAAGRGRHAALAELVRAQTSEPV